MRTVACSSVTRMPNQPRDDNPARTVRIDDELWTAVKARSERERVSASEIVRDAIRRYLN